MAEFCTCGSLIIGGRCTNKSCTNRDHDRQTPLKAVSVKKTKTDNAPAKTARTRRASKCVTYNLYDTQKEEGNNS